MDSKLLARELKKMRLEAKISQNELARNAKISVAFISKLEAGHYKTISIGICKQIAQALGLSSKQFFTKVGLLENGDAPNTFDLLKHALRGYGLTINETNQIIDYAHYVIKTHKVKIRKLKKRRIK